MTDRVVRQLNFARKLLLWTAACLAIALPIAFGLFNATPSHAESQFTGSARFSSVSIKPHPAEKNGLVMTKMMLMVKGIDPPRFDVVGVSPHMLIRTAYRIQETQLTGEPEWTKTQRYDIKATIDPKLAAQMQNMSESQRDAINQQMMRNFLADYFKLTVHQESRDLPVYELVVGDSGSKLQETSKIGMTRLGIGELDSKGAPMSILTTELSQRLGRTVIDKTGLQGNYDFTLHWTPDADETARIRATIGVAPLKGHEDMAAPPPSGPPLVTAVEEQLGLKLQPQTERVPVLIVDSIEQPSQN